VRGWPSKISLADVGYAAVGIDEGWEHCGAGVGGRGNHDELGNPLIAQWKFPNMSALTQYAHGHGLTIGWYLNGCACSDAAELDVNYEGDIRALHSLGFE